MPTEEELRANPRPWMTDGSIDFIEQNLKPTDTVIEYGGGWSSLWWARKTAYTLTVEADYKWSAKILTEMAAHPTLMTKWALKFVAAEWHPTPNNPKQYWKANSEHLTPEAIELMTERYLEIPFEPDVFAIDGSVRPANIKKVDEYLKEHKRTRMVIIDNMESMARYAEGMLSDFDQYDFHEDDPEKIPVHQNGKWCTSVWLRRQQPQQTWRLGNDEKLQTARRH